MVVEAATLVFDIPWARSLKDKRQVARSLVDSARRRFNVSVAEVGTQDAHRTLTLGLAVVSGERAHARQSLDTVIRYMEEATEAALVEVIAL